MLVSLPIQITQVALIEDERRIREGLEALINPSEGCRCVGAFRSMEDALARPLSEAPDVVLVDIGLPGMSGLEGLPVLRERYPGAALVMLTIYEDDEQIFDALCAGACGYLLKRTPPAKLLESLREAKLGGAPMSPEVARRVISLFHRRNSSIDDGNRRRIRFWCWWPGVFLKPTSINLRLRGAPSTRLCCQPTRRILRIPGMSTCRS
jgi:DNA-binding NarL/FixJ family response regulator